MNTLFSAPSYPGAVRALPPKHERTESPPRPRIGLALSSGSAKGLAHIGVIQVLEENGIPIDAVCGVSMGAYVGACWNAGHDGKALAKLAATVRGRMSVMQLADPSFPPRKGFLRGRRALNRLRESIRDADFEDLRRPLHVVATDLDTLNPHVFSHGEVAPAVHASLAIPGICEPVFIEGRRYTDGGVTNPLPVDVLRNLGMDVVIAVNTQPSLRDLYREARAEEERWRESLTAKRKRPVRTIARFLNQHLNCFAKGNLLDTVMRGLLAAQVRLADAAALQADVYIHAYTPGLPWYAFDQYALAIESGRTAASALIPTLRELTSTYALRS